MIKCALMMHLEKVNSDSKTSLGSVCLYNYNLILHIFWIRKDNN